MKKRWLCLVLATAMALSFVGCKDEKKDDKDKDGNEIVYEYTEDVSKYITIPEEYKGIDVSGPVKITDREVEQQIGAQRHFNMQRDKIMEGTVEKGGYVNVTSVGTLEGATEPFESTDYNIDLGKGQFLKEYEDGLIGMKVGETKTISLTFPDDYTAVDYRGKKATFQVTLNHLYGKYYVPEWNDETAQIISNNRYKTVAEFEEAIKEQMQSEKDKEVFYTQQAEIVSYLVENSKVKELPEDMVKEQYDAYMDGYITENENNYGYETLEEYVKEVEDYDTMEEFEAYVMECAENTVIELLCYQAIAIKENLGLSQLEYDNYLMAMASSEGFSNAQAFEKKFKETYGEDYLWKKFLNNKVLECLQAFADIPGKTK